ncbi:MAG: hypothetical protein [Caudoviricetes sp.]|nr:MAG: hypothetical protein [Caudoviricetes sp.]
MEINQRNATRNQSTVDYSTSKLFIFDNRYKEGTYINSTAGVQTHERGTLMVRDAQGRLTNATAENLADIVGVSAFEGKIEATASQSFIINICTKGTIDGTLLKLPATITLQTVVGDKLLTDVLEDLGLHVDTSAKQNTKFDN